MNKYHMKLLAAILPIFCLSACTSSTEAVSPSLPAAPAGLSACTAAPVPAIPGAKGTALSKAQAAEVLADQRVAALTKARCASAWAVFYADLKAKISK